MKKIKLYAIGNSGTFNYYVFDKKKEVYFILTKIIQDIFNQSLEIYDDNNKKINIEKYKDVHEGSVNIGGPEVDFFYGDKRMFVCTHCSQELRKKFNEELFKVADMPKPIK